jgi:two-component system capsular synthesis response regulator RcsB
MFKRVLIVEDHKSVKLAVTQILTDLEIEAKDNYAYDCDSALRRLKTAVQGNAPYELLITDLSFNERNANHVITTGIELIQEARILQPDLKILVFSGESTPGIINSLLEDQQVNGFVRKSWSDTEELKNAVETIYKGGKYVSPSIQPALRRKNAHDFSAYDIALISQLAKGTPQKNIPAYLQENNFKATGLSSIEKRLNLIKENLDISNNAQLIAFCKDNKII